MLDAGKWRRLHNGWLMLENSTSGRVARVDRCAPSACESRMPSTGFRLRLFFCVLLDRGPSVLSQARATEHPHLAERGRRCHGTRRVIIPAAFATVRRLFSFSFFVESTIYLTTKDLR